MKLLKKSLILAGMTFSAFAVTPAFAQVKSQTAHTETEAQTEAEDAITLPDVSTVIQGGAPKAGKSAVPDFSRILPERQTSELVPRLPDATAPDSSATRDILENASGEKSIYAEGLAGLGYPGFFTGKFSVYNQTGLNPFRITFGHETLNGYASNSLTSGYFDRDTLISAEKTFSFDKGKFTASGLYNSLTNGLQNTYDNISDVSKDLMAVGGKFNLELPRGFGFTSEIDGSWYRRYGNVVGNPGSSAGSNSAAGAGSGSGNIAAGIFGNSLTRSDEGSAGSGEGEGSVSGESGSGNSSASSLTSIPSYLEHISLMTLRPRAGFSFGYNGFFAGTELEYRGDFDIVDSFEKSVNHRFEGGLYAGWKNDYVQLKAGGDLVFGSQTGDNPVLVPFEVSGDFSIPAPISVRPVKIGVKGGLSSFLPEVSVLEMENTFSSLTLIPGETSDWLCALDFSLPVKEVFTFGFSGEFRSTAFGNGTWTGDYDKEESFVCGQYLCTQKEMTQVNTKTSLSFKSKAGIFGAEWQSAWADKSANQFAQFVKATYSFQTKNSFFTFDSSVGFTPDDDRDHAPFVDFEAALKVSSAVRLAISGTDIVKLVSGSSREYAGKFISRSGNIALLAKFVF